MYWAAASSASPPISPAITISSVSGSASNSATTSPKREPGAGSPPMPTIDESHGTQALGSSRRKSPPMILGRLRVRVSSPAPSLSYLVHHTVPVTAICRELRALLADSSAAPEAPRLQRRAAHHESRWIRSEERRVG